MERFCMQCGTKLGEGEMYCPNCGAPANQSAPQAQGYNQPQQNYNSNAQQQYNNGSQATGVQKTNAFAIASLVCSLVGLFFFPLILGILAISFSIVGKKRMAAFNEKGKGLATAGLVIGIIDLVWWGICLVIASAAVSAINSYTNINLNKLF